MKGTRRCRPPRIPSAAGAFNRQGGQQVSEGPTGQAGRTGWRDESMTLTTEMMQLPLDPGYAAAETRRTRTAVPSLRRPLPASHGALVLQPYLPIAVIAALDAVFGGMRTVSTISSLDAMPAALRDFGAGSPGKLVISTR